VAVATILLLPTSHFSLHSTRLSAGMLCAGVGDEKGGRVCECEGDAGATADFGVCLTTLRLVLQGG
jgi:hypothetical protein